MMKRIFLYLIILVGLCACSDDDSFTTSRSALLTFSVDTVKLDTVFSTVGSSTYTFWAYNHGSKGVRIPRVYLKQRNQTGFRVNVDGSYLDNSLGSQISDLEVRRGDSIRVLVELTAPLNAQDVAQQVKDDLVFQLESGVEQQVCLTGYAWDAIPLRNLRVSNDTLIESKKPIVVYGDIVVDTTATLTIRHTQLFFHDMAGITVYGRLLTDSVLMRGDRMDHMFDYLPYDRVSGQWGGISIGGSSTGNELYRTELRSGMYGIRCDSALLDADNRRLYMEQCVVHNCKGHGLELYNACVGVVDCQISNTLGDCVVAYGGLVDLNGCTLAQFYPFSADRGVSLRFLNQYDGADYPLKKLSCTNSILTGYEENEVVKVAAADTTVTFDYAFDTCLLRTPADSVDQRFKNIVWEKPSDEIQGKKHFVLIDEKNFKYDFHLDSLSTAKGMGCYR